MSSCFITGIIAHVTYLIIPLTKSAIWKVGDLVFLNGPLDENDIHQKLSSKQNMYSEIMIVKEALRPYQKHSIQMQNIKMHRMALRKSRDFYKIFVQ